MNSTVVIWVLTGKYEITLPTSQADALVRVIRRSWSGRPGTLDELHLADGTRVTVNPVHVVAVEVR